MSSQQSDLFAIPPREPPGFSMADEVITPEEERLLMAAVDGAALSPFRFQGWLGKRLTASFGWNYDFEDGSFRPTDPIPAALDFVRRRAANFAGLPVDALVQAICIRYDPGAGIGWHRDRPVFEHVVGISLGARATMRFRKRLGAKYVREAAILEPRSIYHLAGEARHVWEHSIAPMDVARRSITFRTLANPPNCAGAT